MTDSKKAPLIVFGEDWGAHPSSTQHLIARIAADRPVVWVNSIGMRRPRFSLRDLRRVWNKLSAMLEGGASRAHSPETPPDPIKVIQPRAVSWPGNPLAHWVNRTLVGNQVRAQLRSLGPTDRPILWLSLPTAVCFAGTFDEAAVVYYAGDDFSALEGVDHQPVARLEADLAEKADAIIAASDGIAAKFPRDKTFIIAHGCDFERFAAPAAEPEDLRMRECDTRPVAGFYGSLSTWLDQDLLAGAAERLPHWRFVLIGDKSCDLSRLEALENIEFYGRRSHRDLPGYVQSWDVSLMPFKDNAQIRACNPLKLREYMAAGTPIVSTDFPALNPYREHIHIETSADRFAGAIEVAAQEGRDRRKARRKAVARESWERKAGDAAVLLDVLQNGAVPQIDPACIARYVK